MTAFEALLQGSVADVGEDESCVVTSFVYAVAFSSQKTYTDAKVH